MAMQPSGRLPRRGQRQWRPGSGPEPLVLVFDRLDNTDPAVAAKEYFFPVREARFGEVLRGVSFTPGTDGER